MSLPFEIQPATNGDLADIRQLFRDYASSLGIDLDYQNFEGELASLPGKYGPPTGSLLIARIDDGSAIGCVALRAMDLPELCEMKRLYVSESGRGIGLGRALAQAILDKAIELGYREMRLDTLPTLVEALSLYRKLGFVEIAAYYDTPISETIFMAKTLFPQAQLPHT